ncbi:MAG: type II toxin-antitoxin system HicB family antitoxin [Calothrix sp. C42_A2020_038]|nr:type II toxin-antitoxin system HicB family antitoxin [Calothrix sp. C42_A2020_038]
MHYQVFVKNQSEQHFVASVVGIPDLTVEGTTEEEVISKLKLALEAQFANGKFVTVEVDSALAMSQTTPEYKHAGIFANDPTFDDFLKKLALIRQESNAK